MGTPIFQMLLQGSTWTPERRYPGGTDGTTYDVRVNIDGGGEATAAGSGVACAPSTQYLSDILSTQATAFTAITIGSTVFAFSLVNGKVAIGANTSWTWNMAHAADETNHQFWGLASSTSISGVLTAGSYVYTFPYLPAGIWYPGRGASIDTRPQKPTSGGIATTISGVRRVTMYVDSPKKERQLQFQFVDQQYALSEYESLAPENNSFEQFWWQIRQGYTFQMSNDASDLTTYPWVSYVVADLSEPLVRSSGHKVYWDVKLKISQV